MKRFVILAMVPAAVMLMVSPAHAKQGDPVPGTSVGLDHDPGGSVAATGQTDDRGNFIAGGLAPGRYSIFIFDRWGNGVMEVQAGLVGGRMQTSAPILERGRSYALDSKGRRLTVTVPERRDERGRRGERRGQITITVVEADTPRGQSGGMK